MRFSVACAKAVAAVSRVIVECAISRKGFHHDRKAALPA